MENIHNQKKTFQWKANRTHVNRSQRYNGNGDGATRRGGGGRAGGGTILWNLGVGWVNMFDDTMGLGPYSCGQNDRFPPFHELL